MGVLDIFWGFFIFAALQPVIRQKVLEATRRRLIARIEEKRGSRVILLVHRQENMNILGIPIFRYIDINDSEEVLRAIHLTDNDVPLDIVLHTPGGLVLAAFQIARAIKRHQGKVTTFIPHYAMSGGTLIALAADEIIMSETAILGPVDPQVERYPAASLLKIIKQKHVKDIDDHTLILCDQAQKAIEQVKNCVKELLEGKGDEKKREELATLLSEGRWTHDYPITFDEAKALGLHVSSDIPNEFYQLMSLFPQPMRRQPTVEYIPTPRRFEWPNKETGKR